MRKFTWYYCSCNRIAEKQKKANPRKLLDNIVAGKECKDEKRKLSYKYHKTYKQLFAFQAMSAHYNFC